MSFEIVAMGSDVRVDGVILRDIWTSQCCIEFARFGVVRATFRPAPTSSGRFRQGHTWSLSSYRRWSSYPPLFMAGLLNPSEQQLLPVMQGL